MGWSLRELYVQGITSGSYLLVLYIGVKSEEPAGWAISLALAAIIAFFAWMSAFRRNRSIADTPTSKIASAAQGYVELFGRASDGPEFRVQAQPGSRPCVWFRCIKYRKGTDDKWEELERKTSDSIFELDDGTGKCMVDPESAEVITTHVRTWYEGRYKFVESQLFPNDSLYALGAFSTVGGASAPNDLKADVGALLAEWKARPQELLKRFDLDDNGQIDLKEWELARNAARREVERRQQERSQVPDVHLMRRPDSGQLFLLSNLSPHALKRRYALWGWFHLTVFFRGVASASWVSLHYLITR